jgi:HlyD family secretion protein
VEDTGLGQGAEGGATGVVPEQPEGWVSRTMRRKWIWILLFAMAVAGAAWWVLRRTGQGEAPAYRVATVERGSLEASVSATGTLNAVTTVQVGTQASGQISAIYVDYNTRVRRGQLIARIDSVLQAQAVREAEAGLERARAELTKVERDYERDRQLYQQEMLSQTDFATTEYSLAVARANAKTAQVALERALHNLAYTSIYAPIDGIVIERNVDVGQTVAASLAAPQLFLIANDLTRMQILASVDESDIGLIRAGQQARFTVQAWPEESFTGTVNQVRLQSKTTENVVNYTVVVEVQNPTGKLLPGMTATVSFVTGAATDVLLVPNAALRLRPTEAMLAAVRRGAGFAAGGVPADSTAEPAAGARLWYLDSAGRLAAVRVQPGLTDGQKTEVAGAGLTEGMQVIVGMAQSTQGGAAPAASPFQTQARPGPPPGF